MIDLYKHSLIYIKGIINEFKSPKKTLQEDINSILPEIIEYIKLSENNVYIKLKKNLILETENIVHKADNLNIQLGSMIHLNPVLNDKFNKDLQNSSLTEDVKKLIKDTNDKPTK